VNWFLEILLASNLELIPFVYYICKDVFCVVFIVKH